MNGYDQFLSHKLQLGGEWGFEPNWMPEFLFGFQQELVKWAIKRGRAALFADCGLGKTPMQLVWAANVADKTDKPVLVIAPLAVSHQVVREGEKFGVPVFRSKDGESRWPVTVTNYERLEHFKPDDFSGVVCDESSILKSFDGVRRATVTEFLRTLPYRLLCTATAAPNDYIELGTSSEALGELGYMDVLNRFFRNQGNTSDTKGRYRGFAAPRAFEQKQWRFKGHAEEPFWRWVSSWARALRRPSDFGFSDENFILPPLEQHEHIVHARAAAPDRLFTVTAQSFHEEREERRRTITERCEKVAELVDHDQQALVWCHLNDEGDLLTELIPDAEQAQGSDSDESKEAKLVAFAEGRLRVLVTKPKIGAWGLNLQNCAHVTFFPSHSYEQYYQGVRRCWRFGQTRPVRVDIVTTEGELRVKANLERKAQQADEMFTALVRHMNDALVLSETEFDQKAEVPAWLSPIS